MTKTQSHGLKRAPLKRSSSKDGLSIFRIRPKFDDKSLANIIMKILDGSCSIAERHEPGRVLDPNTDLELGVLKDRRARQLYTLMIELENLETQLKLARLRNEKLKMLAELIERNASLVKELFWQNCATFLGGESPDYTVAIRRGWIVVRTSDPIEQAERANELDVPSSEIYLALISRPSIHSDN